MLMRRRARVIRFLSPLPFSGREHSPTDPEMTALNPFDVRDAIRALGYYVDCCVDSSEHDDPDVDSLWLAATTLAVALSTALERLVEVDPDLRERLIAALEDFDRWVIDRTTGVPDARRRLLTECFTERRMAALPTEVLGELLSDEDRAVRLVAIKVLGSRKAMRKGCDLG